MMLNDLENSFELLEQIRKLQIHLVWAEEQLCSLPIFEVCQFNI